MELGKAFIVMIESKQSEDKVLELLKKRKDNYTIVQRAHRGQTYPIDYLITSLDNCFLRLTPHEAVEVSNLRLRCRSATPEDIRFYN